MNSSNQANTVKVAVIQQPPVFLNIEHSLLRAHDYAMEAASQGAQIVVFPETWLPGYPVWLDYSPEAALWDYPPAKAMYRLLVENAIAINGPHMETLIHIARKTNAYLVMGAHERLGGTLYNTMIYVHRDGQRFQIHRKLVPTYTERLVWGRGDGSTLGVLNTETGNLGGLICWEHWMPLARAAMHAQRETIHVAQWPAVRELHQIASRHYAFEGQCFVLAAGCILSRGEILEGFHSLGLPESPAIKILEGIPGKSNDLVLKGGSAIIGPDTSYLAGPIFGEPCTLYAELPLEQITEGYLVMDSSGHYSRPDVFHLEVNDEQQSRVDFRSRSI